MNQHDDVGRSLAQSFEVGVRAGLTSGELALGRTGVRASRALLLLLLSLALVGGAVMVGPRLAQAAPVELGIFAPVAGRIVHGDVRGIWGIDPAAPADPATEVKVTHGAGTPLGWSSDGTRLLIMRDAALEGSVIGVHLVILDADGSETQLTERPMEIRGGTIAPDGSRVVFADSGALYSVDADGGPVELVLESQIAILRDPTFAPDGTRIAYVDGRGDWGHTVWVVDVDGSNAHQILANETTEGIGHVRGLAWSPAGDRIALALAGAIYTFATDGSAFTRVIPSGIRPYWSPDGSQIAYTIACPGSPDGCGLAIADADGSNVRSLGFATSGPWHPVPGTIAQPSPAADR